MQRRKFIAGAAAVGVAAVVGIPAVAKGPTPVGNIFIDLKQSFRPVIGSVCEVKIADHDNVGMGASSDHYRSRIQEIFDDLSNRDGCVIEINWDPIGVEYESWHRLDHGPVPPDRAFIKYEGTLVAFRDARGVEQHSEYYRRMMKEARMTPNEIRGAMELGALSPEQIRSFEFG